MNYIEFQIVDYNVYVYDSLSGKNLQLSYDEAMAIIRKLSILNITSREISLETGSCLQFYNVSISTILENKSRKVNKKVSRVNKFREPIIKASAIVMTILTINSIVHGQLKSKKNNVMVEEETNIVAKPVLLKNTEPIIVNNEEYIIDSTVKENSDNKLEEQIDTFYFDYEDRSYSEKATYTREMYAELIKKYSDMYGISSNLMLAIATQESGKHSNIISNGGGLGLFQIQVLGDWNWLGKELSAYNFNLGYVETIVVGEKLNGEIDCNLVGDLEYNIKLACMIMASNLKICNYDIISTIQMYNSGSNVLNLKETYGDDWVNHRSNLPGDPLYLEHVLSYVPIENNTLSSVSPKGIIYNINVLSNENVHTVSKT